jgi:diguanylate cyclase (GGDEF)-like protein
VGDEVLRGVSAMLQREARTVDVVARYGGEEFIVILPETAAEGAIALA